MTTAAARTVAALAREVLGAPPAYEAGDMADRIGRLEWCVAELLAVVDQLETSDGRSLVFRGTVPRRRGTVPVSLGTG
jgi:hypothetical protein